MYYLIAYRPFECSYSNYLNIYNEGIVAGFYVALLVLSSVTISVETQEFIGWLIIGSILVSLAVTWILLLPSAIKETFKAITSCFSASTSIETTQITSNCGNDKISHEPHSDTKAMSNSVKEKQSEMPLHEVDNETIEKKGDVKRAFHVFNEQKNEIKKL